MHLGIAHKINLIVLGVVLALGGGLGAFFAAEQSRALGRELDRRVEMLGQGLAVGVSQAVEENDAAELALLLHGSTVDPEIAYLLVRSPDGETRAARWVSQARGTVAERAFPLRAGFTAGNRDEPATLFGEPEPLPRGAVMGSLAVGVDLAPLAAARRRLAARTALAVALGVAVAWLLGLAFVRSILRRSLTPLLHGIRGIAAGDLSRRVALDGRRDEIGEIGKAFDDMLDRLSTTLVTKQDLAATVERRAADLSRAFAENVRSHEALRRGEERFRSLLERSSELTLVLDREGVVTFATPASVALIGLEPEQLVGRNAIEMVHPDEAAIAREALGAVRVRPGATWRGELRVVRPDGRTALLQTEARNLLDVTAVRGVVVNTRDVTEQRRAEERYLQAQKLETVGRLAGGVAHDFNNLLVVILGYAQLLEEGLRAGQASLDDLAEIRKAGERARDLTRQLLAVGRRQVVAPQVVDLNGVLRDAERLLRRVVGEDVDMAVVAAPDLWPVKADPSQIHQVVLNLVVNARDAMPQGGKLTLETSNADLDEGFERAHPGIPAGPHAMLAVSDTGTGLSPEARAHLFEPFFTTKAAGAGTGLGLATVYGIVKQAGGYIWVSSELGHGTTFEIYLPRSGEAFEPEAPRPVVRARRPGETVLVVEDESGVRGLTVRALAAAGYRVIEAAGGREALERAAATAGAIHLLLTDVVMPDMSGPRLAEALRTVRPDVRVLYTSGYTENTIVHHGVLDPGVDFLAKPFTPSALEDKVRQVLER